jgi:hypothetical protein
MGISDRTTNAIKVGADACLPACLPDIEVQRFCVSTPGVPALAAEAATHLRQWLLAGKRRLSTLIAFCASQRYAEGLGRTEMLQCLSESQSITSSIRRPAS